MQESSETPAHIEPEVTVRAPWHIAIPSGLRCEGKRGMTNGETRIRCSTCKTDIVVPRSRAIVPKP